MTESLINSESSRPPTQEICHEAEQSSNCNIRCLGTFRGVMALDYVNDRPDHKWRKQYAALAYEQGLRMYDVVESVDYQVGNTVVLTHQRWMEHWGYGPYIIHQIQRT